MEFVRNQSHLSLRECSRRGYSSHVRFHSRSVESARRKPSLIDIKELVSKLDPFNIHPQCFETFQPLDLVRRVCLHHVQIENSGTLPRLLHKGCPTWGRRWCLPDGARAFSNRTMVDRVPVANMAMVAPSMRHMSALIHTKRTDRSGGSEVG